MRANADPLTVRCAWGVDGLRALRATGGPADATVVVDVLSFTTTVEIALTRGATVFPAAAHSAAPGEDPAALAASVRGVVAVRRDEPGWSLSPASIVTIPPGTRLVLPSPNGAATVLAAAGPERRPVFAACLRNAAAVAAAIPPTVRRVDLVPAGEQTPDGRIRFASEDWFGVGALVVALGTGGRHPLRLDSNASAAASAFCDARETLAGRLRDSLSGRELILRGYPSDVELAAELNVSSTVPRLEGKAFTAARGESDSIERRFFDAGRLKTMPAKRTEKDQVLALIVARIPEETPLPEPALNALLKEIHPDFCTLRRELVDLGLLVRAAGVYRRPKARAAGA